MGKFDKFLDKEIGRKTHVTLEKKKNVKSTKTISDKLVSIKLYESAKKELKSVSYQTNKSQTWLMGELVRRYLPMLEQELIDDIENVSDGQTSIYDFLEIRK